MKRNSHKQRFILAMVLVIGFLTSVSSVMAAKTVKEELDAAKKAKKTVFLVVTGNGVKSDNSMKIAQQAQKQMKESVLLTLNRDDKTNSEVVNKLGLISAPLPIIMVVDVNGLPAGGLPEKEATAEKLVQMVPSPKKSEALGYINDQKPVFIIGYKKSFTDRNAVLENCKTAITTMKGKAAYVEIDMDNPQENKFLAQVGANLNAKNTQIIVFNAQGKNTGSFNGATDPNKLTTAALTVPKSCCPKPGPGCGK